MRAILMWAALSLPAVLALQSVLNVAVDSHTPSAAIDKIVFIKLHHVGSSTMAAILRHYCESHGKSCFVDTDQYPFPGYTYSRDDLASMAQNFQSLNLPAIDIFPNHAVLDTSVFDALIPGNFKFSLFRSPLERVMSSLRYTLDGNQVLHLMSALQQNMHASYCGLELMSGQITVEQVEGLDCVMLTEEYDMSLMMLRRAMGWSMFDMMYFRMKENSEAAVYNATMQLQEYLSRPADSLNDATKAYLQTCAGPNETAVYLAAKAKYQKQWEQLSDEEQQEVLEETSMFQAAQASLQECCDTNPKDSYCVGLMEDDIAWTVRYQGQGYWFTSIRADGSTPESQVAQETACASMVKGLLASK